MTPTSNASSPEPSTPHRRSRAWTLTTRVACVLALFVSALGCGESGSRAPSSASAQPIELEVAPNTANYSPFVLDVQGQSSDLPFHLISFKDVGMSIAPGPERELAYETLAEALSLELASDPRAPMSSSVRHDAAQLDPSAHVACEGDHVYVDVWRAGDDGAYGYSLWSGCGEDDRFAYNDTVAITSTAELDPLAVEIADSLRSALQTGCFQRHC